MEKIKLDFSSIVGTFQIQIIENNYVNNFIQIKYLKSFFVRIMGYNTYKKFI